MRYLSTLNPGTRFQLAEPPCVTGVLVKVNDCRAVVRLDQPEREVEFVDQSGERRQFRSRGSQLLSWAPTTLVVPVGFQSLNEEESDMSKKTKSPKSVKAAHAEGASATKAEKASKATKTPKAKKPQAGGKLSCIDAAAKLLGEAKEPMTTKEMIEAMASKGYWKSPGGRTPAATLYSAILRLIQKQGKEARFKKTERGKFALNG